MKKIRVLVVDDSVVIRRVLSDALSSDPVLEVAGVAAHGRIALAQLDQLAPDLVVLDIEMPEMDGLETLKALRKTHPRLPVVMFSTLTERGAVATLDAFALGASDYVTKPSNVGNLQGAKERIQAELIPKIKALCNVPVQTVNVPASAAPAPVVRRTPVLSQTCCRADVVAIGCSTGGPNALTEILPQFPREFPLPILIVQHMPPMFTRFLAERLDTICPLTVREAAGGEVVTPGTIWIAPGNFHMIAVRDGNNVTLALNQAPPENSCRPSEDVMFRSVAEAYSGRVIAAVLTGMGQDGLRGCEVLVDKGSEIVAQDEATSVVWGMPGFVARAGLANQVLPLSQITEHIVQRVRAQRGLGACSSTQASGGFLG
jgi:two-component system chemotaxis response regulator CheB